MTPRILDDLLILTLVSFVNAALWTEVVWHYWTDSPRGRLIYNMLATSRTFNPLVSNHLHRNFVVFVLGWSLFIIGVLIGDMMWVGPHLPAAGVFRRVGFVLVVGGLAVWFLIPVVSAFNRPRFLVPPYLRGEPGWVAGDSSTPLERDGAEDPGEDWGPISMRTKWVGCGAIGGLMVYSVFRLLTDDEWIFVTPLADGVLATSGSAVIAGVGYGVACLAKRSRVPKAGKN